MLVLATDANLSAARMVRGESGKTASLAKQETLGSFPERPEFFSHPFAQSSLRSDEMNNPLENRNFSRSANDKARLSLVSVMTRHLKDM